jgi:hypothetical protein
MSRELNVDGSAVAFWERDCMPGDCASNPSGEVCYSAFNHVLTCPKQKHRQMIDLMCILQAEDEARLVDLLKICLTAWTRRSR